MTTVSPDGGRDPRQAGALIKLEWTYEWPPEAPVDDVTEDEPSEDRDWQTV